ncbi:hypothetical protein [Actinokineospora sp. NPDC004072]
MAPGSTGGIGKTAHPHSRARYRTTVHGAVVVVPTRCPSGLHVLTSVGYRIVETGHTLHVTCDACPPMAAESAWSFTTNGQQAISAEFDDGPYAELFTSPAQPR